MTVRNRHAQDDRLVALPARVVLGLLGPPDGAADRVLTESLRLDQLTRGLDPETALLRITFDKWQRQRRRLRAEKMR
jgi:hypothetical protein